MKDVTGTYIAPAEMELRTSPGGSAIANGGTQALGSIETAVAVSYSFTVHNLGSLDLLLNGSPSVDFSSISNCGVVVTTSPGTTVGMGSSTTFDIEVTPTADGSFSFDMTIDSNDPAAPTYLVHFTGDASTTPTGGTGGGGGGGGDDGGCSTGGTHGFNWMLLALLAVPVVALRLRRNAG